MALIIGLLSAVTSTSQAQATEGYVSGFVRDSSGVPQAEVTVLARNQSTGFQEIRRTDNAGRFVFAQLPIGKTLLRTAGFDAASQNYRYTVNQNFGQSVLAGNRYQVQAGVRYNF